MVQKLHDQVCELSDKVLQQELELASFRQLVHTLTVHLELVVHEVNGHFSHINRHLAMLSTPIYRFHERISSLEQHCGVVVHPFSPESSLSFAIQLEDTVVPVACDDATFPLSVQNVETLPVFDQTSEEGKEGQEVVGLLPLRIPKLAPGTTTLPSSSPKAHASSSHNISKSQVQVPMCWLCGKEGHEKKRCPRGRARK